MTGKPTTEDVIAERWRFFLEGAQGPWAVLVQRAAKEPELRRFCPFRSMNALCFSRALNYPYDKLPFISAEYVTADGLNDDRYEARGADHGMILAGTLDDVIAAVVRALAG